MNLQLNVMRVTMVLLAHAALHAHATDPRDSLFDEQHYRPLLVEAKAARVGDVLTVIVQEISSAESTADLRSQRGFSISADMSIPRVGQDISPAGWINTGNNSDGTGRTKRTGRLLAQLSVQVFEVLPNGDLSVTGRQRLRINGEEQLITLSGIVRPRDIGDSNTVLSSRIAQARIEFDGDGFVTDQSRPGLLAKIFNFLGF